MLRKVSVGRLSGLLSKPKVQRVGPGCLTCLKPITEVTIMNEPGHIPEVEVLLRCHGEEEVVTLEMGTANWTFQDAGKLINKQAWFDPYEIPGVIQER